MKSPPESLTWPHRSRHILGEILRSKADIVCLEEVDHFQDFFVPELSQHGFEGVFKPKIDSPCVYMQPNSGPDGCALFFRSAKFSLLEKKELVLKDPTGVDSHQVAILVKLECKGLVGQRPPLPILVDVSKSGATSIHQTLSCVNISAIP